MITSKKNIRKYENANSSRTLHFIFSIPEEVEIYKNKTGLLTHASSYSKSFPYKHLNSKPSYTVVHLFRQHLQLRGQFRPLTEFPIKRKSHLILKLIQYIVVKIKSLNLYVEITITNSNSFMLTLQVLLNFNNE